MTRGLPDARQADRTVLSGDRAARAAVVASVVLLVSSAFVTPVAAAQNLHAGSVSPGGVDEGETVKHTVTYQVTNVSNDGNTDELFLEFPNEVNASVNALSSFSGDVTNTETGASVSVSSSPTLVDGPDGDGVKETVRIAVQPSGQLESVDLTVSFRGYATWPTVDGDTTYPIDAAVIDSKYSDVGPSQVTSVTVRNTDDTTSTANESATMNVAIDSTTGPVTVGETLTTTATVTNDGNASGTQTITLSADNTQADSTAVSLDAGDSTTVSLSWATAAGDVGDHPLTVASANDSASTTVTVQEQTTDDSTPDDSTPPADEDTTAPDQNTASPDDTTTSGDSGPGFGIVAVLAALGTLVVAVGLRER